MERIVATRDSSAEPAGPRHPTTTNVAEIAGVSIATVSRVVSGSTSVSPRLRGRSDASPMSSRTGRTRPPEAWPAAPSAASA